MRQRVGLVVLSSLVLLSVAAAPPRRQPPPKKEPAPARQREPQARPLLVITEIMYDPQSSESDDVQTEWVEIHNRGSQSANLRGLQITSGARGRVHEARQRFVLPDATVPANGYALIGIGAAACYVDLKLPPFAAHCGEAKYAWLVNTGDSVAIRDAEGNFIDEVVYQTESPWPAARGAGASIQFVPPNDEDPTKANDDPANWVVSNAGNSEEFKDHGRGTPGAPPKSSDATTQPVVGKKK